MSLAGDPDPPSVRARPPGTIHCVTCADEGIPMRVASIDRDAGLATCEAESGQRAEVLTALVDDVRPGDLLLVHAGTALLRLDPQHEGRQ